MGWVRCVALEGFRNQSTSVPSSQLLQPTSLPALYSQHCFLSINHCHRHLLHVVALIDCSLIPSPSRTAPIATAEPALPPHINPRLPSLLPTANLLASLPLTPVRETTAELSTKTAEIRGTTSVDGHTVARDRKSDGFKGASALQRCFFRLPNQANTGLGDSFCGNTSWWLWEEEAWVNHV
jgi:hypothetical protein